MYHQLNDLLKDLIRAERFRPGDRFLTERDVSSRFGVSRVTANKALSHLVVAGLLELRKGIGTFVRGGGLESDLRSLVSFTRRARATGQRPTTRVLKLARMAGRDAGAAVRDALEIGGGDGLYYFERLRMADGVPVILEKRYLVARFLPGLRRYRLAGSLYGLLEDELGIRILGAEQTIRAISLAPADARKLKVRPGAAALWVHAVGHAREPLWLEDTLYQGGIYEFTNVLGEPKAAGSEARPPAPPSRLVMIAAR